MYQSTPSLNVSLDFSQILGLALQLNGKDQMMLCRELTRTTRAKKLMALRSMFQTDEISEEEIRQECESVRQAIYEQRLGN